MPIVYTWEAPLNSPGLEKSSRSNNGLRRTVADRYSILVNREDAHRPPEGEISGLMMGGCGLRQLHARLGINDVIVCGLSARHIPSYSIHEIRLLVLIRIVFACMVLRGIYPGICPLLNVGWVVTQNLPI